MKTTDVSSLLFFGWSKPTPRQVFSVGMSGFTGIYLFPHFSPLEGQIIPVIFISQIHTSAHPEMQQQKNKEHVAYLNLLLLHRKKDSSPLKQAGV